MGSKKKIITLKRIIIHELKKKAKSNEASLDLSIKLCDIDNETKKLIALLDNRYSKADITHARFKTGSKKKPEGETDDTNKFMAAMDGYYKDQGDESFISFTKNVMENLGKSIKNISQAKGGYFVFADYDKYVGVFVIRHTKGILFEKDKNDEAFKVNPATHIDFGAMAMACRINKKEYENKKKRYLSFISRKNEPIAQYFTEWFFARDIEDSKNDTIELVKIIKAIPTPIDEETKKPIPKDEFIGRAKSYIESKPQRKVNVRTFAKEHYGDPKMIIDYAKKKGKKINTVIQAHKRALKGLEVIIAKADEIELRFPTKFYKSKVSLSENELNIIIIDSLELANDIREQLGVEKEEGEVEAKRKGIAEVTE